MNPLQDHAIHLYVYRMKRFPLTLVLLSLSHILFAQKSGSDIFYLWDSSWNNVPKVENAHFFTRVRFVNDTCWQHHNYKIGGPMLTLEEYKDREAKIPHGRFSYMDSLGRLDSTGYVVEGKVQGTWYFFSDTASVIWMKKYSYGKLLSVWNASDSGKREEGIFGVHSTIESDLPGPAGSWSKYVTRNIRYPPAAKAKGIQGTVLVSFTIDPDGRIQDEFLSKSVEFTLDDEAIRLLKQSPKWTPAVQNGKTVKSFKRQPVLFKL